MSPQTPPEPPKCCCFNIKTATVALGIFHMVMSILLLIEYSLEVANGKGFCKDLEKDYYRIADITTSFLLILMLFVISFHLLLGVLKMRERFLIPFLALQVIDFLLSLLTMFSSYIQVPAIISVSSLGHTGHSRTPLLALQLLDFCLSILTLCSSYMEVPTFLSLKPVESGGSLPALEKLPAEEYVKVMITFTIAFVAVLALKAYMFKCVLSCFKFIKASRREEVKVEPHAVEKGEKWSWEFSLEHSPGTSKETRNRQKLQSICKTLELPGGWRAAGLCLLQILGLFRMK
ncbi:lysosomal-associated transmembrane protein 5 isoform X2 [Ammospiza nelsoni]|uniref:lysosomal-associated transmembrane protein 5 isoform X2 n=1 Tax=Ammospiza caudacuta TaxID=2857398 RepID=UPI002738907F|nr:lysosomal-associated transmembrane protein 5 isoform X2 [Ammospiza caudacuta]XP_059344904.1 lysosomal-associated transmembrane protein 5 isoform X2 [Ammospiza nelsoni]